MEEFAYLSSEQKSILEDLPFPVLLPTELPSGWVLAGLDFEEHEEGSSFSLKLVSGPKQCFLMTTDEGIGDAVPGVEQSNHQHPDFGVLRVEHEEDGASLSDWIEVENGWSAVRGEKLAAADLDLLIPLLVLY